MRTDQRQRSHGAARSVLLDSQYRLRSRSDPSPSTSIAPGRAATHVAISQPHSRLPFSRSSWRESTPGDISPLSPALYPSECLLPARCFYHDHIRPHGTVENLPPPRTTPPRTAASRPSCISRLGIAIQQERNILLTSVQTFSEGDCDGRGNKTCRAISVWHTLVSARAALQVGIRR